MEEPGIKSWDVGEDVMQKLDDDTVIHVLKFLDTPSDLARAACVSRSWHRYVSEGSLWRGMCIKCFPEMGNFKCIFEAARQDLSLSLSGSSQSSSVQYLEEASRMYHHLLWELQSPPIKKTCIREPLHASSTDHFPRESIAQTLLPRSIYPDGQDRDTHSYWSSEGQIDVDVPETLTYALISDVCVVHEVNIQPFKAYFQADDPIYSAKAVRFRFGYSASPWTCWSGLPDSLYEAPRKVNNDDYVWTYESPSYAMLQEDELQTFRLPRPVLCIGGIFQIEFNGRVQTQQTDSLYYICVSHVSVCGTPLLDCKLEGLEKHDGYILKYSGKREHFSACTNYTSSLSEEDGTTGFPEGFPLSERLNQIRTNIGATHFRATHFSMLIRNLAGTGFFAGDDGDSEDERPL